MVYDIVLPTFPRYWLCQSVPWSFFGLRKSPAIFRPQETLCHHKDHRTIGEHDQFQNDPFFPMLSLQWLQIHPKKHRLSTSWSQFKFVKVHHVSLILQLTCNFVSSFSRSSTGWFHGKSYENPMKNGGFRGPISGNLRKPPCFPTSAASQACGVAAGQVLLLVPRIGELGQRNFAAVRRRGTESQRCRKHGPKVATDCTATKFWSYCT